MEKTHNWFGVLGPINFEEFLVEFSNVFIVYKLGGGGGIKIFGKLEIIGFGGCYEVSKE